MTPARRASAPPLAALLALAAAACSGGAGERAATRDASIPAVYEAAAVADTVAATDVPHPVPVAEAPTGAEEYAHVAENDFQLVSASPLSTFAFDVDAASYGNVRRFLDGGALPPAGAVRIEELVNYFDYDYPDPAGEHPFAIVTEASAAPWNPRHRLVHVGLQGRRVEAERLPPSNLVFLVDVSGSMAEPAKLPLVQRSLRLLVERLREEDRVAIVVYAGAAGLVLPSTPGHRKREILDAIDALEAGGSTAGGEGIVLAYRVARENLRPGANNRVVLATDGDFNVGVSSEDELVRLIERERESGVFLTVLGFGTGNLKDARMEQLADRGNGNYAYIDGLPEARKVLVEEMGGTLHAIAKDVKVQVEFNPAAVRAYRLIGYENRALAAEDFNDDRKDAGELGAGHSVTALYEIVPAGEEMPRPGVDALRYQQTRVRPGAETSGELATVKLRYKAPGGGDSRLVMRTVLDRHVALEAASRDFRFAAAVAEWGMLLRGSRHRGEASFEQVMELARSARGEDPHGLRAEFLSLVQKSRGLSGDARVGMRGGEEEDDDDGYGGGGHDHQ